MNIFNTTTDYLKNRKLKKLLAKRKVQLEFHNFQSAKFVYLLFNAQDSKSYIEAEKFMNKLKKEGIKVKLVGIVDSKEDPTGFDPQDKLAFVSLKDCNKIGIPQKALLDKIFNKNADILINLYLKDTFLSKYLTAYANSAMKISGITKDPSADFIINLNEDAETKDMLIWLENFMKSTKKT